MEKFSYNSYPDSTDSSPRSREIEFDNPPPPWDDQNPNQQQHSYKVKFMCSYGGKIQPRPHDNQLTYVNGETKILSVDRGIRFPVLASKLSTVCGGGDGGGGEVTFKYQLPGEDLDALISVTNDDDLEHMMHEYDRLLRLSSKPARMRLFLFPASSGFGSQSSTQSDRDRFVEALNTVPRLSESEKSVTAPPNNADFLFGSEKVAAPPPPPPAEVKLPVPVALEPPLFNDPRVIQPDHVVNPMEIQRQMQEFQRMHIRDQEQQQQQQQQEQSFLATKACIVSLLNVPTINNNTFDDFGFDSGFLGQQFHGNHQSPNSMNFTGLNHSVPDFLPAPENSSGSCGLSPLFSNRAKVLKPLQVMASSGSQPTLFQKRAAMRQSSSSKMCNSESSSEMRKSSYEREIDDTSTGIIDISGLNYESDDHNTNNNKGKKKGMPAKNLMAERRRRKKLNDRLYMLRSVVPKISKMDRASILGDAIDYLKELLQRINDLHNELESTPPGSLPPTSSSFHPLTPTPQTLSCRVKEELCPSSLPSPKGQQARVEVRLREGRAVNIHMFCGRRPGLLLATMKALDNLGLDVQQAVISCFNGFALDVFRAEQCQEGQEILPDQIKAVLFDTAGYAGMI